MFKKKSLKYIERDEVKRQKFQAEIEKIAKENMVFVDESGIDHQMIHDSCWTKKGSEVIGEREGGKRGRTSVIAALNGKDINAPMMYSDTMNGELFMHWLENFLVPSLKKGQVVIIDNASLHKVRLVKETIEEAGCSLMYLPPYSPDFNPIENYWAVMKSHIRKIRNKFTDINEAIIETLQNTKCHFNT